MPRDKDFKRLVRTRMEKTGESYTAARAHLARKTSSRRRKDEPERDYAAIAGMSDAKLLEKTGRVWKEWVGLLDGHDAAAQPHRDIARLVHDTYGVDGWWSQTVTVGYERIRGLRERGQRRDGHFEVSRSRTFAVPIETLFQAWADARRRRRWLTGASPRSRTAIPPRSLRLAWPDGTTVVVYLMEKGPAKSTVSIQHLKLPDRAAADTMKTWWSTRLDALGEFLTTG